MYQKEAALQKGLRQIAQSRASKLSFVALYSIAYQMALHKRGDVARDMTDEILRKLSLVSDRSEYSITTDIFHELLKYGETSWADLAQRTRLTVVAEYLYTRRVARHWRLVYRLVRGTTTPKCDGRV
tara:strand:+ start:353 stop:733 length:381 start_codon:yes stop_codon:yes gene_type:complete